MVPRSVRIVLVTFILVAAGFGCEESAAPTASDESAELAAAKTAEGSAELAASRREVRLRDDCDPATFNAELGEGTCVGDGNTTIDEFFEELREKQEVGAWKNDPDGLNAKPGERILVVNEGGEAHTFTRVAEFGGGIVPELNELSGNDEVAPECEQLTAEDFQAAGTRRVITTGRGGDLPRGRHRFECCIHPWMRTVVEIRR